MPGEILVTIDQNPSNMRKTYCKATMGLRQYVGTNAFSESFARDFMIRKMRKLGPMKTTVTRGKTTVGQSRDGLTSEDAARLLRNLISNGYIAPSHRQMRDKAHPKIPQGGVQMWKLDPYRIAECSQESWYKASIRKREWRVRADSLDIQRCRALRHIYSLFGMKPFTYDMVTSVAKYMRQVSGTKSPEITQRDKEMIKAVIQSFEASTDEFRKIWSSLIRNNYIIPFKKRDIHGKYVQTNAYVVNKALLRRCLGALEV
jgi:hypothetical protein